MGRSAIGGGVAQQHLQTPFRSFSFTPEQVNQSLLNKMKYEEEIQTVLTKMTRALELIHA